MLNRIRTFFDDRLLPEGAGNQDHSKVDLAAGALLYEMVKADFEISAREMEAMRRAVQTVVKIDGATTDTLVELAEQEARDATSLYQFTRLINEHYSAQQKANLVEALWKIAYADGRIDKYEEHYLRRVCDLLHLPHSTFIQAKIRAQEAN